MPPTSRVSRPSIARTIHQRAGSQAPTTPIRSSPLARSSTPTPPKAAASPQLSSRSATPSSRNSIIIGDSPGKALPLTDTAPDLNDYVRLSPPFKANLKNRISHKSSLYAARLRRDFRKWTRHLKEGQISCCKEVSTSAEDLVLVTLYRF